MKSKVYTLEDQEALARKIGDDGEQFVHTIIEYTLSLGATGHNVPTPPRPKHILARVIDASQGLASILKVLEKPEKG